MIKRNIKILYYLGLAVSILVTNHLTLIIPYENWKDRSYLERFLTKLFYLTNIGATITFIYSIIWLYQTINQSVKLSTRLETFYRSVLKTNAVVMVAFWSLYSINPLFVHTE